MRDNKGFTPNKVVGLLMHLLKEIRENRLLIDDVEDISTDLINQGYSQSEINAAFTWVYERLDGIEPADTLYKADTSTASFRVLHPAEHSVIGPTAYGMLVEMNAIGMLKLDDMERIIERAMAFGGPLGTDELQMMVHSFLFEEGGYSGFSGTTQYIQSSDTVH
ncbi:MAG: DUF494 family protein [Candidatus Electryonea clarkiae]|nr:DUF494 family protein [Candidatus Electryonea clarkiae]MDP8288028.1 DUF494 family protein [Candidatus Electryonea clarkiae]